MGHDVRATYRVQLTPTFDLDRATEIVPYLSRLGVSHLYASPIAQATVGSTHGYDVTDHHRVRDELGGAPALHRLWEALDAHGMGMVVDLVPNHMGIRDPSNRWWQDLLRHGRDSRYASYFDVDWNPPDPASQGRVVLPFLDRPLDEAVADGMITVRRRGDAVELEVCHHGDRWPASDVSLAVLGLAEADCAERLDGALDDLHRSPAAMVEFLAAQHWRAVHWRDASERLNWRRFFDITDLAAVRVEEPAVFDDVHVLLRSWLDDELGGRVVQGVRVDHVDGLADPETYLVRLRALVGPERLLVVEKILGADEALPPSWPVDGTTGYEVIARLDEALTTPAGAVDLQRRAAVFTGGSPSWSELEQECRHLVADRLLRPEVDRLARAFLDALAVIGAHRPDPATARDVIAELAAGFEVYRTYARPGAELSAADRAHVDEATARALASRPDLPPGLFDAAHALLVSELGTEPTVDDLVTRFGQVTAPLAAKSVEDTAFYRMVALPWLTEVGGDPGRVEVPMAAVVTALAALTERWPGTFSPLTTHDTKRSGDVRARLSRLALDPDGTADAVARWHGAATDHRSPVGPDPAFEWELWMAMVGAWPVDTERMATFATKAMREAKVHTTWTDPDEAYEDAVQAFLAGVLADEALVRDLDGFVADILASGRAVALAQVAVAATAVGSPDLYQGAEVWDLALVDPDNRRPVDHQALSGLLAELEEAGDAVDLVAEWARAAGDPADAGRVKLALWHRLLQLRHVRPEAFAGPLTALDLDGDDADDVLAYRRGDDVAVVAPLRRPLAATASEPTTVLLPSGRWRDLATRRTVEGGPVAVAELVTTFPVAVLVRA